MTLQAMNLFGEAVITPPSTEGIKYAGSKLKLLEHILRLAETTGARTVLDGFAGTTRVSQAFAKTGYEVVCNDISEWSKVFGTCYLQSNARPEEFQELIDHLNSLAPVEGWLTTHYGGLADTESSVCPETGLKKPWQRHNTMKADAVRQEIDRLDLPNVEKAVALTSLILALDKVDSTLGHFASYLQNWSPRSYKEMKLAVPEIFESHKKHTVLKSDIFDILPGTPVDLAYFDPPYGSNNEKMPPSRVRYASYYHVWSSICLNDSPELFGKALRRVDTSDTTAASIFEEFRKDSDGRFIALNAIEKLIQSVMAEWIILSYSSGGRATAGELHDILNSCGEIVEVTEIDYKRNVMSQMRWTDEWLSDTEEKNVEFLFLLHKN